MGRSHAQCPYGSMSFVKRLFSCTRGMYLTLLANVSVVRLLLIGLFIDYFFDQTERLNVHQKFAIGFHY